MKIGDVVIYNGRRGKVGPWCGKLDGWNLPVDFDDGWHTIVQQRKVVRVVEDHLGQRC